MQQDFDVSDMKALLEVRTLMRSVRTQPLISTAAVMDYQSCDA
jgi:hypothetical protein